MDSQHKRKRATKIVTDYTLRDAYRKYLKSIDKNTVYNVPETTYTGVCAFINDKMINCVIEGKTIDFYIAPYLGSFSAEKRKTPIVESNMRINWKLTKEYGVKIYHDNRHTNGYYCKFRWLRSKVAKNNREYFFRLLRKHDRYMSELFATGKVDYPLKTYTRRTRNVIFDKGKYKYKQRKTPT